MSISPVSFNSGVSQTNSSSANSIQQTFKQLAKSLQSGDLEGAQKAFSSLQQLLRSGPSGQSASTQDNPIQNDFAALGQALSAGDLSAAQSDFTKLQTDLKAAGQSGDTGSGQPVQGAHRHGHHFRPESSEPASTTAADTQNSPGGTVNLYA
jgi:hypothetical protein